MTSTAPVAVIPDDLIKEVLSFLPVNSLVRFRCVSKFWKTLISDPYFVKLHLKNSQARNPLFTLITYYLEAEYDYHVVPYSLHRLIENPPFTLTLDPYYHVSNKGCDSIVGTCNGLILLLSHSELFIYFRVWNPATRTISPIFGRFMGCYAFCFGCDESTDTYKIVASGVRSDGEGTHVSILSLGENFWYSIHPGPVPYHMERDYDGNDAVYLCSTVNWLAIIGDGSDLTVEHFVISSLDLKTETFNQYSLPTAFDELPRAAPIVAALGGFLSFSYFYMKTDFVIWQMNEFGVEDSWTQFLKISLQNLLQNFQRDYDHLSDSEYSDEETNDHFQLVPVLLSEDADTLVLKCGQESRAILYNWRDIRVERTKITTSSTIRNSICWYSAKNFVESLVSTF